MKPTLSLNKNDIKNVYHTLGLTEMLTYLRDSDLFDITYHNDGIRVTKGFRASIIYYNDKKVYLDLWEYSLPTYTTQAYDFNFDIIIKIQHKKMCPEGFEKLCQRKRVLKNLTPEERLVFHNKMVPWTFFPSRMMMRFVGKEDEIEKVPIEQVAFFCGKNWKCRHKISQKVKEWGIDYITSSQELKRGRPLKDDVYFHKMITSKFGLVLAGRGSHFTEAKNRREIDYMMLKKPLLLNYKPNYYNPLVEGKHYIYIDENTELEKLENMYNIEEIAQNGYQWYKENASKEGVVKTFLQIVKDKLK